MDCYRRVGFESLNWNFKVNVLQLAPLLLNLLQCLGGVIATLIAFAMIQSSMIEIFQNWNFDI